MNNINKIINKYACVPRRYTIKNDVTIIDTDGGPFVFKKKKRNNNVQEIYRYLKSRGFDYFPKLIASDEEYDVYEYLEDVDTPREQKAQDIIYLLSQLHNQTTYYKEMDIDEYKEIYEEVSYKLNNVNSYYNDLMSTIERKVYMSPSEYHLARNVSILYAILKRSQKELEDWYDMIKENPKKRMVAVHNNLDISHLIRNNNLYLLSWDKAKMDMPIYDLYQFYRHNALDYDFNELFNIYESAYPLQDEEKKLLYILISIPEKVEINNTEFQNCRKVRQVIDYIYKTVVLTEPYYTPNNTEEK